ncbi:MAG TPA: thioredoxin family protein [Flavobacteriales bacterium]
MRHLLSCLALLSIAFTATAQDHANDKVKWVSLEAAQAAAKKDGKPLLIDVYTKWCGPCKMLAAQTFNDEQIAAYINANFHPVKFDAEGPDEVTYNGKKYGNPSYNPAGGVRNSMHQLTSAIAPSNGRIAYPTVVYMDKDGKVLAPVQGFWTAEQIEPLLNYFATGEYLKGIEFDTYRATFKSKRKPATATP